MKCSRILGYCWGLCRLVTTFLLWLSPTASLQGIVFSVLYVCEFVCQYAELKKFLMYLMTLGSSLIYVVHYLAGCDGQHILVLTD